MHVYSLGILYFSGGSRISLSFPDPLVVTLVDPPVTALYLDIPEDGTIDKQGVQISLASNILVSFVSKKPKAVGVVDKHPRVTTENAEIDDVSTSTGQPECSCSCTKSPPKVYFLCSCATTEYLMIRTG